MISTESTPQDTGPAASPRVPWWVRGRVHEAVPAPAGQDGDEMFNLALDMFCVADSGGRLKQVNPAFTKVLGWEPGELLGQPLLELVEPTDRASTSREFERLKGGQPMMNFENRCRTKEGGWRVLSWKALPRTDGQIYAMARDVTLEKVERKFHQQTQVFQAALMALRDYEEDDVPGFFRHATAVVAEAMQVERVSIWLFNEDRTSIQCNDLVHRSTWVHETGLELTAENYPAYFESASKRAPIVADDAHTHPATREFSANYLTPMGITSMMDVPLIKDGVLRGVVCHEHTGTPRKWSPQEVEFATAASGYVTMMLERARRRAAEAKVSVSEAHLNRVIEASGLGCWDWNVMTDEVTYSGHWALKLGYDEAQLQPGRAGWVSLIHPDDRAAATAALNDHLEGRSPVFSQEYRLRTRDGQWRWILSQGRVASRDASGRPVHVSGIHKDIHEHRMAQEALRDLNTTLERRIALRTAALQESEARFRQLAEGIESVFWTADKEMGAMTYVSPAYERIWGRQISSFGTEARLFYGAVHEEDRGRVMGQIAEVRRQGGIPFQMEYRIVQPSGAVRVIRDRGFPVRDDDGKVLRMVGVADDVTDQMEAQRKVRQALETLDATEDGAFIFDPATLRFTYVNQGATRQLGFTNEELLRMTPLDIAPDFDDVSFRVLLTPLQTGEQGIHRYTTRHRRKDGEELPVEISLQFVARRGEEPRFIAIVRDITERLRMEQRTSRSQRLEAIGTLAGGVAHDLNNALAPILMGLDGLKRRHPDETHVLDIFEASANRGAGMVRQLLTFAKGAEGERASVQPALLIRELREILRGTFPKNIELQVTCEQGLPTVQADATQLHQILLNLCVNARDAMPDGGTLTVEARRVEVDAVFAGSVPDAREGTYLVLRVSDTGTGIPPEIMDRIFDPFFTTKAPNSGTGLGLSTAMGLVKGHGGFLQVQSKMGEGTTFTVHIPAEPAAVGATPPSTPEEAFVGHGELIMLVDDEVTILDVTRMALKDLQFEVITAKDGVDALVKAAENRDRLCAVITDQHMPHMDGLAFVRALRRVLPDVPIAVGSGRLDDGMAAQFKGLDVAVRLDKPYSQDKLTGALKTMLEGRKNGAARKAPPATP